MISFVGRSNSGKTTLLEKLIPLLQARGYRVGLVKHTYRRDVETDVPGTDTRRLWEAGAEHVAFFTPERVVHTHRCAEEPSLAQVLGGVSGVDVILLEGTKRGDMPKIEVVRAARDPHLIPDLAGRVACVTDVAALPWDGPRFGFEDVAALADFVEAKLLGPRRGGWREIDHTADLALRVWGRDLPALFAAAAEGMVALTAGVGEALAEPAETIALAAPDVETLLVDWLNELLYLSEVHDVAWGAFRFAALSETRLEAAASRFAIAERRNAIKAATFHNLAVERTERGYETEIVFDI